MDAAKVNQVAAWLGEIVRRDRLPQKLLVVHQFTHDMIKNRQKLRVPRGVKLVLNVDGFGDRPNKVAKYHQFTHDGTRFHRGYKLFYEEDTGLMRPRSVLALQPPPDLIVYE